MLNATRLVVQETKRNIIDAETRTGRNKNEGVSFLELNFKKWKENSFNPKASRNFL
jgi:hypothetical protein